MPVPKLDRFLKRLDALALPELIGERLKKELTGHLEDRADELMKAGLSLDDAWQQAELELGDLQHLAGLENQNRWRKQRRNWMRFTTLTIIGGFVATVMIMSSWPESSRISLIPGLSAQGHGATLDDEVSSNAATEESLARRHEASFYETPLSEVLDYIAELYEVDMHIDRLSIEDFGIDLETPVTIELSNVRGSMLLELVLRENEMAYSIRDGIVLVTSVDENENNLAVKVYNCRSLLQKMSWSYADNEMGGMMGGPGGMGVGGHGHAPGMMPGSGGPDGGVPGSGAFGPGGGGVPGSGGFGPGGGGFGPGGGGFGPGAGGGPTNGGGLGPATGGGSGAGRAPRERRRQPNRNDDDPFSGGQGNPFGGGGDENPFEDKPLERPRNNQERSDDGDPFGDGRQPHDSKPSDDLRFRWVLAQMGGMMGSGGMGGGGFGGGGGMAAGGSSSPATPEDRDLDRLTAILIQTVSPDSWDEMGGAGSVTGMNGLLVIRQTYDVHAKVENVLQQLEAAVDHGPRPAGGLF